MKCNVGTTDRLVRIIAGVIVVLLGFYFKSWWGLIGLILLATGLFRFCPLYVPFKISTYLKK
jgi:type IV secretory pathway TrbD component